MPTRSMCIIINAIACNPDSLRGGKIFIQEKRSTNCCWVSVVRDLCKPAMNESSTKGILVTTSNFGYDAYDFAKNKPIKLIGDRKRLNLLLNYGYKAKIALKEAKRIGSENKYV